MRIEIKGLTPLAPATCGRCIQLEQARSNHKEKDNVTRCKACDKEMKESTEEVCGSCQTCWLVKQNKLQQRLKRLKERDQGKVCEDSNAEEKKKRPKPSPGNLHTDARAEGLLETKDDICQNKKR